MRVHRCAGQEECAEDAESQYPFSHVCISTGPPEGGRYVLPPEGGRYVLMADLCCRPFRLEIRLAVAPLGRRPPDPSRAAPEDPCREHQRFHQHLRIFERQVVEDGIALTSELLHDMHLVGVEVPAAPDPCRVDEADGIE